MIIKSKAYLNYLKESPTKTSNCPFLWFKTRLGVYPDFAKYAAKYLTVQTGLNEFIVVRDMFGQL